MNKDLLRSQSVCLLVLRLAVGGLMLFHGVSKLIYGVGFIGGMLAELGLPSFLAYGALAAELVASILIIIGAWTRVASVVMVGNMAVAILMAHGAQIFTLNAQTGGWGYASDGNVASAFESGRTGDDFASDEDEVAASSSSEEGATGSSGLSNYTYSDPVMVNIRDVAKSEPNATVTKTSDGGAIVTHADGSTTVIAADGTNSAGEMASSVSGSGSAGGSGGSGTPVTVGSVMAYADSVADAEKQAKIERLSSVDPTSATVESYLDKISSDVLAAAALTNTNLSDTDIDWMKKVAAAETAARDMYDASVLKYDYAGEDMEVLFKYDLSAGTILNKNASQYPTKNKWFADGDNRHQNEKAPLSKVATRGNASKPEWSRSIVYILVSKIDVMSNIVIENDVPCVGELHWYHENNNQKNRLGRV